MEKLHLPILIEMDEPPKAPVGASNTFKTLSEFAISLSTWLHSGSE